MDFKFPTFSNQRFDIKSSTILLSLAGSRSYGTDTSESDFDYKGILVEPKSELLSPFKNFQQAVWTGDGLTGRVSEVDEIPEADEEGIIFGLRKFVSLASQSNPNVIELLFVDDRHIQIQTVEGKLLRDNRDLFLSNYASARFGGYAMSQLKRIKTHKRYLDDPPKAPPTRAEFGLTEARLISTDQMNAVLRFSEVNIEAFAPWLLESGNQYQEVFWEGVANLLCILAKSAGIVYDVEADSWLDIKENALLVMGSELGFGSDFMEELRKEKRYATAKKEWKSYERWIKDRNPARAELEMKYKFDTKHAMHLVRLLRMGKEILEEGVVRVYRPDREELKAIRGGALSYDELIIWAEQHRKELDDIVRSGRSVLPKEPDKDKIEKLVEEIYATAWSK